MTNSCFRYHKGTDFQANHNTLLLLTLMVFVVLDTTKVQIFKQITTKCLLVVLSLLLFQIPQRYRFSSKSQPGHRDSMLSRVVLDTTKVQIFKQITTQWCFFAFRWWLFQIPQRYRFSSKSQPLIYKDKQHISCFRYHKGTDFQANHNYYFMFHSQRYVVLDTTKVQIFKQITTGANNIKFLQQLFQIPQRYRFSSKSQQLYVMSYNDRCCFRYHKGTDFQANHNRFRLSCSHSYVVLDTTKVQIFKQITTVSN